MNVKISVALCDHVDRFGRSHGLSVLEKLELSPASRISIQVSLELLWKIEEAKGKMSNEIILTGESLRDDVELLITIKGITPLSALAFLADIAYINRFKSLKHMNAYLGLVPKSKDSGGKRKPGHINRESGKLTRTLLTQSVRHIANSSLYLRNSYSELRERKGAERARIAIIRKVCGIMRRMLLNREEYRWIRKDQGSACLKDLQRPVDTVPEVAHNQRMKADQ
jgi:transposase